MAIRTPGGKYGSIFQMDGTKAKLNQFIFTELFFDDSVDLVLSGENTNTLAFSFEAKSFANKTLEKFNSFHSL